MHSKHSSLARVFEMFSSSSSRRGFEVFLNVYDIHEQNDSFYPWGFGFFHSGVEINGIEYMFSSGSGIVTHSPKDVPNAKFRESVKMGSYLGTQSDIDRIITQLRSDFPGNSYNIILKNCNEFSTRFVRALLNKEIPGYVNRAAALGSFFSCLLPPSLLQNAPVQGSQGTNSQVNSIAPPAGRQLTNSNSFKAFSGPARKLGSS